MGTAKGGVRKGGGAKIGRNETKAKKYAQQDRQRRNAVRRLQRHLATHPTDPIARKALERLT